MTESNQRNNELAQLEELFGTTDLLSIVGVKNKEAYLEAPTDTFTARQAYLRTVLRIHPDSNCISAANPDQRKEYVERCHKLFILRNIYEFLTSEKEDIVSERDAYFNKDVFPKLLSLELLNDFDKCRKRFGIPSFETVATELKEIYAVQMRRLREIHGENFTI